MYLPVTCGTKTDVYHSDLISIDPDHGGHYNVGLLRILLYLVETPVCVRTGLPYVTKSSLGR